MAESAQLMRQWRILQTLSHRKHGVTLQELSQETEVSSRTIARDLTVLKTVGFPVSEVTSAHSKKQWKITGNVGIAQLQFTLEETAALYLGRQFLELMAHSLLAGISQRLSENQISPQRPCSSFSRKTGISSPFDKSSHR